MYWTSFVNVSMCNMCECGALRGQKKTWDSLDLELWMVMINHVDVGS